MKKKSKKVSYIPIPVKRIVVEEKESIWNIPNFTRISFWLMIALWILTAYFDTSENEISPFAIFWILSIIPTFVLSIIHLKNFKEKAFAITSLVISSIWLLFFILGVIVGFFMGV